MPSIIILHRFNPLKATRDSRLIKVPPIAKHSAIVWQHKKLKVDPNLRINWHIRDRIKKQSVNKIKMLFHKKNRNFYKISQNQARKKKRQIMNQTFLLKMIMRTVQRSENARRKRALKTIMMAKRRKVWPRLIKTKESGDHQGRLAKR